MALARQLASLVAAAALAAPLAAGAAGLAARSTSASFTVSAVVVRPARVALRAMTLEAAEREPGAPAQAPEPRRVAIRRSGAAAGTLASGAETVVFVDGAPPSWRLRGRRAAEPARQ